jgi:hypothetical protein
MTDLDPMLREAMSRVRGPIDARPSLGDVRRRARRRNRRRMSATVGVVACAGVATTALIIRRDSLGPSVASPVDSTLSGETPSTRYLPDVGGSTTISIPGVPVVNVSVGMVWDALRIAATDPSGAALALGSVDDIATREMPTAQQFGCTAAECAAMFTYVLWHGIARDLGFANVYEMQAVNPNVDFSVPPVDGQELQTAFSPDVVTATTNLDTSTTMSIFEGIILIDGGAPAGAMDDVYQRLPGYDRTIVPGTGKPIEQTEVMPIGDNNAMASSIAGLLGIGGLDTWDPSYLGSPIQGMVAVIVGPDYWGRVGQATATSTTTTTSVG